MSIETKEFPGYPDYSKISGESGYINPCFECIDKDCINCVESLPGAWHQRAWKILREKIDNDLVDTGTRRAFKKLMHESMQEAKK